MSHPYSAKYLWEEVRKPSHWIGGPAVSFRFVYLHKLISKCETVELGDQLRSSQPYLYEVKAWSLAPSQTGVVLMTMKLN